MKIKYLLLSLLLISFVPSHAQFGKLKKGLKKIKKKKNKASKKVSKTTGKGKATATGEPAYDANNPIYRAFSVVKNELKSAENRMSKAGWEKEGTDWTKISLDKARKNLDVLKADAVESKKPYYKTYENKYASLKEQHTIGTNTQKAKRGYFDTFYNYHLKTTSFDDYLNSKRYLGSLKFLKYATYKSKKDEYLASDAIYKNTDDLIAKLDKFYNQGFTQKQLPRVIKYIEGNLEKMEKMSGGKDAWKNIPKSLIKEIDASFTNYIEPIKVLLPSKNSKLDDLAAKLTKRKKFLEEYISSGKYDAYVAKIKQEIIDRVRLGNVGTRNAQFENLVRRAFANEGTVLRVVINSTAWTVSKNELTGRPLFMFHDASVAVKAANGKCYRRFARIKKSYLGGGNYGQPTVSRWDNKDEMNCNNVNK